MSNRKIILASQSPRRQELLKLAGIDFEIQIPDFEETYPDNMDAHKIPEYLAEQKASIILQQHGEDVIVIAADTMVFLEDEILGKPKNTEEAKSILGRLSGKMHEVITGVAIMSKDKKKLFSTNTKVYFKPLGQKNIEYYVQNYKPLDKAGAYGIQEWIGLVGIEKIEGCYNNVVGLPVSKVVEALKEF